MLVGRARTQLFYREGLDGFIMEIIMSVACVFCRIVRGELPAVKVYEDEYVIAFLDIKPINPGHTLVVPKRHVERLEELEPDEAQALLYAAARIAPAILRAVGGEGYNILMNIGSAAGQEIPHLHLHIIPRYTNDKCRFNCPRKDADRDELESIGKMIREAYTDIHGISPIPE